MPGPAAIPPILRESPRCGRRLGSYQDEFHGEISQGAFGPDTLTIQLLGRGHSCRLILR
jgi:hypothetical protein